jgi:hypothetical protein
MLLAGIEHCFEPERGWVIADRIFAMKKAIAPII